ncbi:hypothetical protein [Clostridium lundense]|uniref:hypothetical protein n=1 Tax=Clostridium lundense TaxID=319475 RepID=UPI000484D150|nr:hypothetical protein [Clostridium lundense]
MKNNLLDKAIKKMDFGKIIHTALSVPNTCALAVGPKSCIRIFYFQGRKKNLNDRLYMLPVSEIQLVSSTHLDEFKEAVEEIFIRENPENLIVLIMCPDIILGSNFENLVKSLEEKYRKNIKLFKRGPLVDNMMCSSERMMNIVNELSQKNI